MLFSIVLVFCFISLCHCEEPKSCSQFYYVDKLLEKMIRSEIKSETLEKVITNTISDVHLALDELKIERELFKNEIMEIKNLIKDFQIKSEGEKQTLENKFLEYKNETREIIENMVTPNIMFKARTVKDKSPSQGDTMIFQDIMFNYGDGYDETTGIFTAPISGNYMFTIQMCVTKDQYLNYGIMKDSVVHTIGLFHATIQPICYTADAIMRVNAGQKVWLKCTHNSSSGDTLYESTSSTSSYWNTFSGMLVHV